MWQLVEYFSFVFLGLLMVLAGVFTGLYGISFQVDLFYAVLNVVVLDAVLSSIVFAFVSLSLAAVFLVRTMFYMDEEVSGGLPGFTAVVPVYMEHHVLERSVESLRSCDVDLDVLIVCEGKDEKSIERAGELSEEFENVFFTVNTSEPGSKAGAINHAVEEIGTEVFGVFDVDEQVDPDFVSGALSRIRGGAEVVQGRAMPEPEGFFESLVFFEQYLAHLNFQLVYILTGYRLAGSRTTVMKKSVWEETGGYNTEVLTEDYHFSFKCYRDFVDVRSMMSHPSRIEAAHNLKDWWNQRKRWMAGYFQVFFDLILSMNPLRYRDVISAAISFGSIIGSMMMVFLASKFLLLLLLSSDVFFLLPISTVWIITIVLGFNDSKRHGVNPNYLSTILSPIMFSFYGLVALKAFSEAIFRKNVKWYSVTKNSG